MLNFIMLKKQFKSKLLDTMDEIQGPNRTQHN